MYFPIDKNKRHVRMGNAGHLQTLEDFHQAYQREKDVKLILQKRNRAATIIQSHWRAHTCKSNLTEEVCVKLAELCDLRKDTKAICLLSLMPVTFTWRSPHSDLSSRRESLCKRQMVERVSRERMMTILLETRSNSEVVSMMRPRYVTSTGAVKDWLNAKEGSTRSYRWALPPMWICLLMEYICKLCPQGPGTTINDEGISPQMLETSLLVVLDSISVWTKLHANYCSRCVPPGDVDLCLQRITYILTERRIHNTHCVESLTLYRAAKCDILGHALASELCRDRLWDHLDTFIVQKYPGLALTLLKCLASGCVQDTDFRTVLLHAEVLGRWAEILVASAPQYDQNLIGTWAIRLGTAAARIYFKTPVRLRDRENEFHKMDAILALLAYSFSVGRDRFSENDRVMKAEENQISLLSTELLKYLFDSTSVTNLVCRLQVLFLKSDISRYFSTSVTPSLQGPDGVEKSIMLNLLNSTIEEDDDEDESKRINLFGFIEPIDMPTFDQLVICTNMLTKLHQSIGQEVFENLSITKYVDKLGLAPEFLSDLGLQLKTYLAMILRRCLLLDDHQFVSTEDEPINFSSITDTDSALKIWLGDPQTDLFPLKKNQLCLLCHFLNCLSLELLVRVCNWSADHKLILKLSDSTNRFWNLSYLLIDLTRLTRFLHRRFRRLNLPLDQWVLPQVNRLMRFMRVQIEVCPEYELFKSISSINRRAASAAILISLNEIPHSICFKNRVDLLQSLLSADRRSRGMQDAFIPYNANLIAIRRSHIVEDSAVYLMKDRDLRAPLRIQFLGEDGDAEMGVDGGGLFREWIIMLAQELFSPERRLFKLTEGGLIPSMDAYEKFQYAEFNANVLFELAGIVVGKALYESLLLSSAELNYLFLNRILGEVNFFDDLKLLDLEIHKNILFIKHYEQDISELSLTFSLVEGRNEIQLVPNGSHIKVTNENKNQYILLLSHYLANSTLDSPARLFLTGLLRVIDLRWLRLFDAYGLQQLISGVKQIGFDVDDLRPFTKYAGYEASDQTIVDFWDIVAAESPQFRSKLLHFVTSTDKTPLLGFQTLNPPFCIIKSARVEELPSASTCVNLIKLPDYGDKQILRRRLKAAVEGAQGFHLA